MKKSAIAVAVAAVLAAPVALADVQISGQLQTQVVSIGGDAIGVPTGLYVSDGGQAASKNSNAGNWGALNVAATEDLGDGMKALAKYAFNVQTGDGVGTREAYVGVAGGFGAVLGGRLNHPYKSSTIGWDPFVATFMQARGNGGMVGALYGAEIDNALAYAGTFGAVKVVAAMVVDEARDAADATKTNGKHATSFSVNAPVGPVEVALAYINLSEMGSCANVSTVNDDDVAATPVPVTTTSVCGANGKNASATKVGAKFGSGDVSVAAQVEMLDKGLTGSGKSGSAMLLTGSYKMGNNTVSLSYGNHDKNVAGNADGVTYLAVGLNSAMSKNTSAFVGYRNTDAGSGAAESAIGAGLRVKF